MKVSKYLIIPSLVMALVGATLAPSATLAEENLSETDSQLKVLTAEELQQLSTELKALYISENIGSTGSKTSGMTTMGIKSKAATKVASMLLKSGDKTVDILKSMGLLDAAAAKSFKKVTGKVGNFVDTIASAGDSAAAMARSQLPGKLKSWGITNKGTQEMIANAVSYAIKAADWIFL